MKFNNFYLLSNYSHSTQIPLFKPQMKPQLSTSLMTIDLAFSMPKTRENHRLYHFVLVPRASLTFLNSRTNLKSGASSLVIPYKTSTDLGIAILWQLLFNLLPFCQKKRLLQFSSLTHNVVVSSLTKKKRKLLTSALFPLPFACSKFPCHR